MKVGVLFGGCSSEKEISLESGRHIYNSLDTSRFEAIPIFVSSDLKLWRVTERLLWMNATADIEKSLPTDGTRIAYEDLRKEVDFAFLGLHGKYVEDGALQGLLELQGIPYNGPRILGASIGMDKIFQKHLLRAAGLHHAKNVVIGDTAYEQDPESLHRDIEQQLGFPCIIKPSREGCSTGITKVNAAAELPAAITEALRWDRNAMAEEFLTCMEVTCTILGNDYPEALLPTETPSKGAFLTVEEKFLPGDAQMITPPRVPAEDVAQMQADFVRAYKAMNLRVYSRIDGFWDTEKKILYINEPNTLPGVTPSTHVFHQAAEAGMSPTDFFSKVIDLALEEQKARQPLQHVNQ